MHDEETKNLAEAVDAELGRTTNLEEFGFEMDEDGQLIASGCTVTFYSAGGGWEVDISLPNGSVVGFDIAYEKVSGKTAEAPHSTVAIQ